MDRVTRNKLRKNLQRFLKTTKLQNGTRMIDRVIDNTQADLFGTIPKLERLRKQLKSSRGQITYSVKGNYIKFTQPRSVTTKQSLVFYQMVKKWGEDNNINLHYNPSMNVFYLG